MNKRTRAWRKSASGLLIPSRQRYCDLFAPMPFANVGPPKLICDGADFDGTDLMIHSGDFSGIVNGSQGTLSVWVRFDVGSSLMMIMTGSTGGFLNTETGLALFRDSSNQIVLRGRNTGGSVVLTLTSSGSYGASSAWRHILASWDVSAGVGTMYINDVEDCTPSITSGQTLGYTLPTSWGVCGHVGGNSKMDGGIAELWFSSVDYFDLDVTGNRRKYVTSDVKPVVLASDGSKPTGSSPIVYCHLDNGETVSNFALNRGSAADFSITGTLATTSTSPSD
jgi:hypothetical protein